ncbi:MAG: hypothetical protein GTO41_15290, partial [Burkholderiales bacterium]|nr:hypothetical protein [Burkholderiales bacterium]
RDYHGAPETKAADKANGDEARPAHAELDSGERRRGGRGTFATAIFALLIALAAAAFTVWQNYELQRKKDELESEYERKLEKIEKIGVDSHRISSDARDVVSGVEARLGQLEVRLVEMQNQRLALESLYDELSQSRDQWTLAEVEQILLVASQQLQLAGNVKAALIALRAADARLARSDRPKLTPVRRAIVEDIERLEASPFVDVTGISLKLEHVIDAVDGLPLAIQTRPSGRVGKAAVGTNASRWRQLISEIWQDVLSLVRIERVEAPEATLLAPDQTFFLRENLKLRLLGARLALLGRDQVAYRADLAAAIEWSSRYFDLSAPTVASSIETLKQLAESDIRIELPDVSASLDAVRSYRLTEERTVR